jgi:hypothetical protein
MFDIQLKKTPWMMNYAKKTITTCATISAWCRLGTTDHEKSIVMNITGLYQIPDIDKAEIFQQGGNNTRLPAHGVEKDWWVL